jgi:hypothetical protein
MAIKPSIADLASIIVAAVGEAKAGDISSLCRNAIIEGGILDFVAAKSNDQSWGLASASIEALPTNERLAVVRLVEGVAVAALTVPPFIDWDAQEQAIACQLSDWEADEL